MAELHTSPAQPQTTLPHSTSSTSKISSVSTTPTRTSGQRLVITDYFVQTGDIGIINTPADFKAQYVDMLFDGSLHFNRSINFAQDLANRGGAKPHSAVVFDLNDPKNPYYY